MPERSAPLPVPARRPALDRTDRVLWRAARVVGAGGGELARQYLEQAEQFQSRAGGAYDAGLFREALRLTQMARRRAEAAIALARPHKGPDFLATARRRTALLLDRIEPAVRECGSSEAEGDFAGARAELMLAERAAREGPRETAVAHLARARERAFSALNTAESACGGGAGRARRSVVRTGDLLRESAWLERSGEGPARDYRRALDLHRDAASALDSRLYPEAVRRSAEARDRLVRALESADPPLARDAVAGAVQRSRERLAAAVPAAGSEDRRTLAEARRRQRRAETLLGQDRLAAALGEASAVTSLLDRLER